MAKFTERMNGKMMTTQTIKVDLYQEEVDWVMKHTGWKIQKTINTMLNTLIDYPSIDGCKTWIVTLINKEVYLELTEADYYGEGEADIYDGDRGSIQWKKEGN